jgi:hypothetical protein
VVGQPGEMQGAYQCKLFVTNLPVA